jgi:hypothetical protein
MIDIVDDIPYRLVLVIREPDGVSCASSSIKVVDVKALIKTCTNGRSVYQALNYHLIVTTVR